MKDNTTDKNFEQLYKSAKAKFGINDLLEMQKQINKIKLSTCANNKNTTRKSTTTNSTI